MAIEEETYYPNPSSIYSAWLVAPVYINYLIVLLKIVESQRVIGIFNIALNVVQMMLLFQITRKLFDNRAAIVSCLLYMTYLNNLGLVLLNLTELMFGILILSAIIFYLSESTPWKHLLCGALTGLSIGVRPTGWALLLVFLIFCVVDMYCKRKMDRKIALILFGLLFYIVPVGMLSKKNIGRFEISSTTGPANLIISTMPNANGVYDDHFFLYDSIYLTKNTYYERNAYMSAKSKEYIRTNFTAWLSLIPRKIYSTFISDNWAIEPLIGSKFWSLNNYIKGNEKVRAEFKRNHLSFRVGFWLLNIWQLIVYGTIMVLFFYQLTLLLKRRLNSKVLILLGFIVIGMVMTIIGSVGNPRYKYNFVILAIAIVSPIIVHIYKAAIGKLRISLCSYFVRND